MTKVVAAFLVFCIVVFETLHLQKANAEEVLSCYTQCKKDCLKEAPRTFVPLNVVTFAVKM
ncbi:hypothetical protein Sjap_015417 [Stephania japonica]|uniref:Uncharacterized protein n=1 Tax=Stephania japonica TaxID=461633 RepID=A0AAP0NSU6_9MAGN